MALSASRQPLDRTVCQRGGVGVGREVVKRPPFQIVSPGDEIVVKALGQILATVSERTLRDDCCSLVSLFMKKACDRRSPGWNRNRGSQRGRHDVPDRRPCTWRLREGILEDEGPRPELVQFGTGWTRVAIEAEMIRPECVDRDVDDRRSILMPRRQQRRFLRGAPLAHDEPDADQKRTNRPIGHTLHGETERSD